MKFLAAPSGPAAPPTSLRAMLSGIKRGIVSRTSHAVARFANYNAASPTATTTTGGRIGTNPNSTFSRMQEVGMGFTSEWVTKNIPLASAYLGLRQNYCSSMMKFIPDTGDSGLNNLVREYLHGEDGYGGVFGGMGVDCSMQAAFLRTADIEMPVRGDAGLIWLQDDQQMRLMEFSADQLGEIYSYVLPRSTSLARDSFGNIVEVPGKDCIYYAGRYFRGCDCVAYKIYQRTNSWYASPKIYPACDVLYFRDDASYRGVRGVTFFASAIQHMEKGEALFQIGMDAALRQAKTAMIVYNNRGQPDEGTYASAQNSNGTTTFAERLPQGPLVEYFYNGDKADFASPDSPGPELIQGVETSDERVALALRLNYSFLCSPKNVGGAPSRLDLNKAAKEFTRIKETIHKPQLRKISYVSIMDGVRRGELPPHPKITKGHWMLPISPTVDAGYDASENIDNLRAGLESPQDLIAETNRNARDVITAKGEWAEMCAMEVELRNRNLVAQGFKPTITIADIAQVSDNPQHAAAAENIIEGKPAAGGTDQPQQKAA